MLSAQRRSQTQVSVHGLSLTAWHLVLVLKRSSGGSLPCRRALVTSCTFVSRTAGGRMQRPGAAAAGGGGEVVADCAMDDAVVSFLKITATWQQGGGRGEWSDQETLLLLEAVEAHGEAWPAVAAHVGTKSGLQCAMRFLQVRLDLVLRDTERGILDNLNVVAPPSPPTSAPSPACSAPCAP